MTTFLVLSLFLLGATAQECSDSTLRRCRKEGLEAADSRRDDSCKSVRENFDCVLWQSSACLDKQGQEESREPITRLWRHLKSFCEDEGSWYTKACFQREELRRCEALLPAKGYSTDDTACRSYSSFRDCATSAVRSGCTRADARLLGTYLMEKGGTRAWNCPRDARYASAQQFSAQDAYYGSGDCSEESRESVKSCRTNFDSARREAGTRTDSDMRHHNTCCALVHYEECVERALRCRGDGARSEARTLVAEVRQRLPYDMDSCGDHTTAECSASSRLLVASTASLLWLLLLLL